MSNFPKRQLNQQRQCYHQTLYPFLQRTFSTKIKSTSCPFQTLGVPSSSQYSDVKKEFFKLALKYHPDTAIASDGEDDEQDPAELFHQIRTAFESLMEDPNNGKAIIRPKPDKDDPTADAMWKNDAEFDSWFKEETGYNAPFMFEMDIETMREVAEMTEDNEGGGLDRGGMWHLAKMVSQNVKDNASTGGGLLQLDAGETQEEKGTRLSRRRRRPR